MLDSWLAALSWLACRLERKLKTSFALAISVAGGIAASAAATEEYAPATYPYRHHRVHHRIPAVRNSVGPAAAASLARPAVPPAPKVENDSDGLSRDPEDCNMGCLDNTE